MCSVEGAIRLVLRLVWDVTELVADTIRLAIEAPHGQKALCSNLKLISN